MRTQAPNRPKRWREPDSGIDPELRELLDLPSRYAPTPQELSRLAARLERVSGSAAPQATRAAHGATLLKLFMSAVVLLVLGLGALWFWPEPVPAAHIEPAAVGLDAPRSTRPEQPAQLEHATHDLATLGSTAPSGKSTTRPERLTTPQTADPALGASRGEPGEDAPTPTADMTGSRITSAAANAERGPSHALQPATRRETPRTRAPAREPARARDAAPMPGAAGTPERAGPPIPSELALLGSAQSLLAHDPRAALEPLSEHARLYARGQFAEEREALAVDALRRLGRRAELRERARAFLAKYPKSPQRERIEQWLR